MSQQDAHLARTAVHSGLWVHDRLASARLRTVSGAFAVSLWRFVWQDASWAFGPGDDKRRRRLAAVVHNQGPAARRDKLLVDLH